MPLQLPRTNAYCKVQRAFISNKDRVDGTDYDYTVRLKNPIDYVVGAEVIDFSFNNNLASPFVGHNKLDFRLKNPAIFGGNWKTLTAIIPLENYTYDTQLNTTNSYVSVVQQAMNIAIYSDADFANKIDVVFELEPAERTEINIRTLAYPPLVTWPGYGSTEAEFLFGTGPNKDENPSEIMGFPKDTDFPFTIVTDDGILVAKALSPFSTNLNRFRYADVLVDEFSEYKPLYRALLSRNEIYQQEQDSNQTRTRLLTNPVRKLEKMTIRIRLQGDVVPSAIEEHNISFILVYLSNEQVLPNYVDRLFLQ